MQLYFASLDLCPCSHLRMTWAIFTTYSLSVRIPPLSFYLHLRLSRLHSPYNFRKEEPFTCNQDQIITNILFIAVFLNIWKLLFLSYIFGCVRNSLYFPSSISFLFPPSLMAFFFFFNFSFPLLSIFSFSHFPFLFSLLRLERNLKIY